MTFRLVAGVFASFADSAEVRARDPRLFESTEGITDATINSALERSSARILTRIRNTDWWASYFRDRTTIVNYDARSLGAVDPDNILIRHFEFRELNVSLALSDYILPATADWGNETSAEVVKIRHYTDQFNTLFEELISVGDWYDFSENGTVTVDEREPVRINRVRIR